MNNLSTCDRSRAVGNKSRSKEAICLVGQLARAGEMACCHWPAAHESAERVSSLGEMDINSGADRKFIRNETCSNRERHQQFRLVPVATCEILFNFVHSVQFFETSSIAPWITRNQSSPNLHRMHSEVKRILLVILVNY